MADKRGKRVCVMKRTISRNNRKETFPFTSIIINSDMSSEQM